MQILFLAVIAQVGFNNTLAPSKTCPNAPNAREPPAESVLFLTSANGPRHTSKAHAPASTRASTWTVAIGYSNFCELFTEDEWKGFDYSVDLNFWYNSVFAPPTSRA
ncbi:hypothetical protein BD414DRAFT_541075 [Trametes punicea]|nr:hypothetical protein BD414DRAFT_541075 [Trametes punicea]